MLAFLLAFLYDIRILKSPPVHHPYQLISGIFPGWFPPYQLCFSNKDSPIEILTFLFTCGRFQECAEMNGEHVETIIIS